MRRNKYGVAAKADRTLDGIVFASKREMNRWKELKLLERAKKISMLRRQEKYRLYAYREDPETEWVDIGSYIADFFYFEHPQMQQVCEDVKGVSTPVFKLKAKIFRANYPGVELRIIK